MQGPAPIPVFRPSKLTPGPEFQGSLLESPANIFYQQIRASRATLDPMAKRERQPAHQPNRARAIQAHCRVPQDVDPPHEHDSVSRTRAFGR